MRIVTLGLAGFVSSILLSSTAMAQYYGGTQGGTMYQNPYYQRPVATTNAANGEDLLNQPSRTSRETRNEFANYTPLSAAQKLSYVYVNMGVRSDELQWNIASDITGTNTPNVLSELTWSDMSIYEISGGIRHTFNKGTFRNVYIEAEGYHGNITSGNNQDSDYNGNNRTSEFSRSNNNGEGGSVQGGQFGIGYSLALTRYPNGAPEANRYSLTPVIGYSIHQQNLEITDGNQTIPNSGPFSGLESTYETSWKGPYIGARLNMNLANKHRFLLSGDYQVSDYYAQADWNLRPDFMHPKSYEHEADGSGYQLQAEYGYSINSNWEIFLSAALREFTAEDGVDRTFFSSGAVGTTKLNAVDWSSQAYKAGVSFKF